MKSRFGIKFPRRQCPSASPRVATCAKNFGRRVSPKGHLGLYSRSERRERCDSVVVEIYNRFPRFLTTSAVQLCDGFPKIPQGAGTLIVVVPLLVLVSDLRNKFPVQIALGHPAEADDAQT